MNDISFINTYNLDNYLAGQFNKIQNAWDLKFPGTESLYKINDQNLRLEEKVWFKSTDFTNHGYDIDIYNNLEYTYLYDDFRVYYIPEYKLNIPKILYGSYIGIYTSNVAKVEQRPTYFMSFVFGPNVDPKVFIAYAIFGFSNLFFVKNHNKTIWEMLNTNPGESHLFKEKGVSAASNIIRIISDIITAMDASLFLKYDDFDEIFKIFRGILDIVEDENNYEAFKLIYAYAITNPKTDEDLVALILELYNNEKYWY